MADVVEILRSEIERRKAEIEALETSLKVLTGSAQKQKPKQLALPAPEATREGNYTVNGLDLSLGRRELAVFEAISGADDCIPAEQLMPLCKDNRGYVQQTISTLNKKLKPCGAEILFFRGEGYRLQNIGGRE